MPTILKCRATANRWENNTPSLEEVIRSTAVLYAIKIERLFWQETWFSTTFRFKAIGGEVRLGKFVAELVKLGTFRTIEADNARNSSEKADK